MSAEDYQRGILDKIRQRTVTTSSVYVPTPRQVSFRYRTTLRFLYDSKTPPQLEEVVSHLDFCFSTGGDPTPESIIKHFAKTGLVSVAGQSVVLDEGVRKRLDNGESLDSILSDIR